VGREARVDGLKVGGCAFGSGADWVGPGDRLGFEGEGESGLDGGVGGSEEVYCGACQVRSPSSSLTR
jgi:hypothetical protein